MWGGPVPGAGAVGRRAACQRRLYIDVVGVGRRHLGLGVILVARQLVLFESRDRGLPQRVVLSIFATGRGLAARAFGQREGVVAAQGRDACGG